MGQSRPCARARIGLVAMAASIAAIASACSSGSTGTGSSGTSSGALANSGTKCNATAVGATLSQACDTQSPPEQLNGVGANSIQPFFAAAFYYYSKANQSVTVNYSPAGSSVGVTDIEQNTVEFGDSEVPIAAPATGSGGPILQLPVDLNGVALSYNIPGIGQGLKLDGPTLAGIFLGTIKTWSDPSIAALNPSLKLPTIPIVAVHRADSSGPGYDLDQYLIDTAGNTWTALATTKPSTHWPAPNVGVGEQLNSGVSTYIKQTAGSIGFVAYAYAKESGTTAAALKNEAGDFVSPTPESIAAAGSHATNLSSTNFNIVYGPGTTTYPLANFSWTLVNETQPTTDVALVLGKLFDWVTTEGQKQATTLGYAPLPANAVALAHSTLLELKTPSGQAIFSG